MTRISRPASNGAGDIRKHPIAGGKVVPAGGLEGVQRWEAVTELCSPEIYEMTRKDLGLR